MDYLDAVRGLIIPELRGRPLSVVRVLRGQAPFMQKNVPKYTPPWVRTVRLWAESSRREVSYALCDDRRTLLWFANQRAVEYHPTLGEAGQQDHPGSLVLDIDPPEGGEFRLAVLAAQLVRQALAGCGLAGAVKTSGAKGVHVFVPITGASAEDAAAATRAVAARAERLDPALTTTAFIREDREGKVFLDSTRAGGATVVAAYSPRVRPGVPVSFPLSWDELDRVTPADFTVRTAARLVTPGAPLGGPAAPAAAPPRRPRRRGPHDPGGPGPGHARRQAAGPCPPQREHGPARGGHLAAAPPASAAPLPAMAPGTEAQPAEDQQRDPQPPGRPEPEAPEPPQGSQSPCTRPCQEVATTRMSSTMSSGLDHGRPGRCRARAPGRRCRAHWAGGHRAGLAGLHVGQVGGEPGQVGVGLGAHRLAQALVQFRLVETPVPVVLGQLVGDLGPFGVRNSHGGIRGALARSRTPVFSVACGCGLPAQLDRD